MIIVLYGEGKLDSMPFEVAALIVFTWFPGIYVPAFIVWKKATVIIKRIEWVTRLNALGIALFLLGAFRIVCKSMGIIHTVMLLIPVVLYFIIGTKSAKIITTILKESSESKKRS